MNRKAPRMSVLESTIEATILAEAKALGYTVIRKVKWIGQTGAPDRMFARPGRVVFLEIKRKGKKPDAVQARELERMRKAGMDAWFVDSVEEALAILA